MQCAQAYIIEIIFCIMARVWTGYFHLGLISMRETSTQHTIDSLLVVRGKMPFTNLIDNVSFSCRTTVSLLCSKYLGDMENLEGICVSLDCKKTSPSFMLQTLYKYRLIFFTAPPKPKHWSKEMR